MASSRRLIQISDLHFREFAGDILCSGVVTDDSLRRVLVDILAREGPGVLVLVTGDLVQEAVPVAYQRLRAMLLEFPFRYLCLPGNHDDPALMRRVLSAPEISTAPDMAFGDWNLLTLDSTVPGIPHGRLGAAEVARLRDQLAADGGHHVLLALHHPPVAVRSPWLDRMALADSGALFEAVASSGRVRAILCGHVHQELDTEQAGVRLLATPSTCVQFQPRTLTMSLDDLGPAWRWLDLHPDGRVETGVHYLGATRLLERA